MTKAETAKEAHRELAEKVLGMMNEHGTDWTKPWREIAAHGLPHRFDDTSDGSGYVYTGGNLLLLLMAAMKHDYPTNMWATYNQWAAKCAKCGGKVEAKRKTKGRGLDRKCTQCGAEESHFQVAKGSKCEYLIRMAKATRENEDGEKISWLYPVAFPVFNAAQLVEQPDVETLDKVRKEPDNKAIQAWIESIGADIEFDANSAYYSPSHNRIGVPAPGQFKDESLYFGTLFHELTHWTGGPERLKRIDVVQFGTPEYAFEELVAELGSLFLGFQHGLEIEPRADHMKYMNHWRQKLDDNPALVFKAAAQASKAVGFLNGEEPVKHEENA